jgi:hypothetical protein
MKKSVLSVVSAFLGLLIVSSTGFTQPISTEEWPPDTDFSQEVHYWSADGFLFDAIPSGEGNDFIETITVLAGGDHNTEDVTIAGKDAKRAVGQYMNFQDAEFFALPDWPVIDILVQYFANSDSEKENLSFLLGVLGNLQSRGPYVLEGVTDEYRWHLFRVDNSGRWAGNDTAVDPIPSGGQFGGVNGGTIRMENVTNLVVRAIAWGPEGVFGATDSINIPSGDTDFNPDDYPILAEWNPNTDTINGTDIFMDTTGDQEPILSENIGPAEDQRTAVRPAFGEGSDDTEDIYLNWIILDEFFGPTSQPSTKVKIAVEYYDDPALAGERFGPEVYVTAGGDLAFYPEGNRTTLEGSGNWKEAVYWVSDVKFDGVNVDDHQAAVRFWFTAPIYISRYRLGIARTSGIDEGVDPIPDAYPFDPDPYHIYAQLDIDKGISEGLDFGVNGGDQEYFIEDNVGPENDKRTAIRPALDEGTVSPEFDRFMNFSILDEWFGPSTQPNATVKVAVDYWDNPAVAGERFGPEVYQTDVQGNLVHRFFPAENRVTIGDTDTWKTAVWLVEDVNFTGVNQGPQAAARFWFTDGGAIHISRVQYGVFRPVGQYAGVDPMPDLPVNTPVSDWMFYE